MKVTSLPPDTINYMQRVTEKQQNNNQYPQGQNNHEQKKNNEEQEKTFEVTAEKINQAVEAFATDNTAQIQGLRAVAEGQGPGLKVILKDGSGAIIRQFTGEEFLKLREAANTDPKHRGKLLDRRL